MKISLFDVVALVEDVLEEGLHAGMKGAVVDVHTEPTLAYEVEFCDDLGRTISQIALLPHQIVAAPG
jgi:hypothetical protein